MAGYHNTMMWPGGPIPPSPAAQLTARSVRPGVPGACSSMSPGRQPASHSQNTRASVVAADPVKPVNATAQSGPTATEVSEPNPASPMGGEWKAACERQISWLEEDIAVLSKRIKRDCGECAGPPTDIAALVARLDADAAAERQSRQQLDARLKALEDAVSQNHEEREAHLQTTSNEVELSMKGLIGRIDEGLSAGASSMRQRTDQTEQTLRTLIKRVDECLCAGADALQRTRLSPGPATGLTTRGRRSSQSPQQRTILERLEQVVPGGSCTVSCRSDGQHLEAQANKQASLEGSSKSQNLSERPEVQRVPVQPGSIAKTSPIEQFGRSPRPLAQANPYAGPVTEGTLPGSSLALNTAQPAPSTPSWMYAGRSAAQSPWCSPSAAHPSSPQVPGTGLARACSQGSSMTLPIRPNTGSRSMTPSWPVYR
eukprot:TRINITY_DN10174_c0_g1_i1.p1 TRINITY_DN10174_c0_g1~~TRINITY_DN10174_c0_g1_i1.p1  ORF type:complete len:428 (-),score=36.54 TRINITY_DN10174_c0_g1_i1:70-1353(-)